MHFPMFSRIPGVRSAVGPGRGVVLLALLVAILSLVNAGGQSVSKRKKHVIGATAVLTEASSQLPFAARIDTGRSVFFAPEIDAMNPGTWPRR